jgi:hypothetical protein
MPDSDAQKSFIKSLAAAAGKAAENNPQLLAARRLNQTITAEFRNRLKQGAPVAALGGVVDENGEVHLIEATGTGTNELVKDLCLAARQQNIVAAAFCTLAQRTLPTATHATAFIDLHCERKGGPAMQIGVPVDSNASIGGMTGISGPGVALYGRRVSPVIFVRE